MKHKTSDRIHALLLSVILAVCTLSASGYTGESTDYSRVVYASEIPQGDESVFPAGSIYDEDISIDEDIVADDDGITPDPASGGLGAGDETGNNTDEELPAGFISDESGTVSEETEAEETNAEETEAEETEAEETEAESDAAAESQTVTAEFSETVEPADGTEISGSDETSGDELMYADDISADETEEEVLLSAAAELSAAAQPPVSYIYRDKDHLKGETRTCTAYTVLNNPGNLPKSYSSGWYVIQGSMEYDFYRFQIDGNVNFILTDGCKFVHTLGFHIKPGCSLTIYGQEKDSGRLEAGSTKNAVIGGDRDEGGNTTGSVTINGGTIILSGGNGGAALGAGKEGAFGNITINGGNVTAKGGGDAAGIGDGEYGKGVESITINGGTVNARGGDKYGAGIGGGDESVDKGKVTINGGNVTAVGGGGNEWHYALAQGKGAAIGGGRNRTGPPEIVINGGTVRAEGSWYGAGIGGGQDGSAGNITINGGDVTALCGDRSAAIGGGEGKGIGNGKRVLITGGTVKALVGTDKGSGKGYIGAAIGAGGASNQGGDVIIRGGNVTAESWGGAGIGGGGAYGHRGGNVTISGGTVVASSRTGAGIGGGGFQSGFDKEHDKGDGGNVTISGGNVFASSSQGGAAIGGAAGRNGGSLTITGGYVVATTSTMSYDWVNNVKAKRVVANPYQDMASTIANLLGKKIFSHPVSKSPAAIGGGYVGGTGGSGGTFVMSGGLLIAKSGFNGNPAIGSGSDNKNKGSYKISENLTVQYADDFKSSPDKLVHVLANDRYPSIQTKPYIMISECVHHDQSYKITPSGHTPVCKYCIAQQLGEQPHKWDNSGLACSMCGYKRSAELSIEYVRGADSFVYTGSAVEPEVRVKVYDKVLTKNRDYTLLYENNVNAGKGKITVTANAPYYITRTFSFTIRKAPLEKANFSGRRRTYTGAVQTISASDITVTSGDRTVPNDEYTVSITPGTNVGDYSFIVNSVSRNYTGTLTGLWSIVPKELNQTNVTVSGAYWYNGKAQTPEPVVKDGNKTLQKGRDYTLSYRNNVNAGKAYVIVTCTGNYTGIIEKEFTIGRPEITEVVLAKNRFVYNGVKQSVSIISVKSGSLDVPLSDCVITDDSKTNAGNYTVSVRAKESSNFSGTRNTNWEIAPKPFDNNSFEAILSQDSFTYNSRAIEPGVTVREKDGSLVLKKDTDYTVTYENNTNAGEAKVIINGTGNNHGTGNYTGTITRTFTITKAVIDAASLTNSILVYNGYEQEVSVSEVWADDLIVPADAYTISDNKATNVNYDESHNVTDYVATIAAKTDSNYTGSVSVPYCIVPAGAKVFTAELTQVPLTYDCNEKKPEVTVTDSTSHKQLTVGTDYTVSYVNNTNAGTAKVLVTGKGNYEGTITLLFQIRKAQIKDVTLSETQLIYNGQLQHASISKVTAGGTEGAASIEVPGTEGSTCYTVTGDSAVDAGTYTMTVTAKDGSNSNFTGSKQVTYEIKRKNINDSDISVALSDDVFTYDGTVNKPDVIIMHNINDKESITLDEGIASDAADEYDYTCTYPEDSIDAGNYAVTISGAGNYTGTITKNYKIEKAKIDQASLSEYFFPYNGMIQFAEVTSVMAGNLEVPEEDYNVRGAYAISVGNYDVTVIAAEDSNYTGSVKVPYSIIPKDVKAFDVELTETEYVYDGSRKQPEVFAVDEERILVKDEDYTLTYSNNTDAGTASVKVTGIGGYTGSRVLNFTIAKAEIDTVILDESILKYNAKWQCVSVSEVWADDLQLPAAGNLYTVSGSTAKYPGTYSLTVKAKENSNYTGSVTVPYTIVPADASIFKVSLTQIDLIYDGSKKEPGVSVYDANDEKKELTPGTDYTVAYQDNTNAGTARVLVTGIGNYDGTRILPFRIDKAPITSLTLSSTSLDYIGELQTVTVDEVLAGKLVVPENEYTVTGNSAVNPGSYAVTAAAKDRSNFKGSASARYTINPDDGSWISVGLEEIDFVYDGREKRPDLYIFNGSVMLEEGRDYILSYSNNINAGTAIITVIFRGNYEGTFEYAFDIEKAPIDSVVLENDGNLSYNGYEQSPVVSLVTSRGLDVPERDWSVIVTPQRDEGEYGLTVSVTNDDSNFIGSADAAWRILPLDSDTMFWLYSSRQGKHSVRLNWTDAPGAVKYVIYGNACGSKLKKLKTLRNVNSYTVKKIGSKLRSGKYYKFMVKAVNGNGKTIAKTKVIHVVTDGGAFTNFSRVKIKKSVQKKAVKLKPGRKLKLKAKAVKQDRNRAVNIHRGLRYLSGNSKVASVDSSGVVRAKSSGSCYIYAYTQSGTFARVGVIVS